MPFLSPIIYSVAMLASARLIVMHKMIRHKTASLRVVDPVNHPAAAALASLLRDHGSLEASLLPCILAAS